MESCPSSTLVTLVVFLCVAFTTVTFVLHFTVFKKGEPNQNDEGSNEFCVTCESIEPLASRDSNDMELYKSLSRKARGREIEVDRSFSVREQAGQENNDVLCCATTNQQETDLAKLLSKRLSEKTSSGPAHLKNFASSPAFAQKALCVEKEVSLSNIPDTETCLLNIDPKELRRRNELVRGVEVTNTGLKIIYPGLYFVYKSINFSPDSNKPCKEFPTQTFRSFLIRRGRFRAITLLKSEHTCCPGCYHNSETRFAGGVFQLDKDDIIEVNVTGKGIVLISPDVTYVGLMKMGAQVME